MNFSELVYKTYQFFFNSWIHYLQVLILIFIFNGTFNSFFKSIFSGFDSTISKVRAGYKAKMESLKGKAKVPPTIKNNRTYKKY